MSTTLTAGPAVGTTGRKVTGRGVLRSEWVKFWSLRSSWITLVASVAALLVFGSVASFTYSSDGGAALNGPPGAGAGGPGDAVSLALAGSTFAALGVGVLGVLMSAGEYGTGMVRSTFAAVPGRLPVLWAKATVIGPLAAIVAMAGVLAAFLTGTVELDGETIALSLGDDGVPRSLVGAAVYLGLVAVLGVALGSLVRSTAAGIASLVGILFILPGLGSLLPGSLHDSISPYLPSNAGSSIFALQEASGSLSPAAGLAVFAGWVALAGAGAAVRLKKTDV
ncbi:ABC transporter permease [Streptomyces clavifer]|uniref:ABC transporter permease n=1 Tax=Streptomyces TaxID=1883 RepID=UPI000F54C80B|nr:MULTISPECIES: ABC transporter permease [Streptomyces]MDX3063500.1 ABC transporter permease [Streptomyces sp. ND04-05B]RPK84278.1 ABC-2 family transporter protein [Streptomyces sp. ADI97-07]WUC31006.1 ABC transporter permease [Streptomyces clavifer]